MLNTSDAEKLANEIREEEKKCMKDILNHAKMALDDSKFILFKKIVFNGFGKSGLENSIKNIIDKYTEK